MKSSSRLAVLVWVFLALAACNQPAEEKATAKEGADAMQRELPECAQRNTDGTYKHSGGCSREEWAEWSEKHRKP